MSAKVLPAEIRVTHPGRLFVGGCWVEATGAAASKSFHRTAKR